MSKHTPGPWLQSHRRGGDGMYRTQVYCEQGETIATLAWYPRPKGKGVTGTDREGNARLISAAPELLAVAVDLLREYEGDAYCACDELIARANAAIAKATGENHEP